MKTKIKAVDIKRRLMVINLQKNVGLISLKNNWSSLRTTNTLIKAAVYKNQTYKLIDFLCGKKLTEKKSRKIILFIECSKNITLRYKLNRRC